MADVTYYVALPFLQDDTGAPVAGAAAASTVRSGAFSEPAQIIGHVAEFFQ